MIDLDLPDDLKGLAELALDLRWSWSHDLDALWRRVSPELWTATRNPWLVLQSVGRPALDVLASDEAFTNALKESLRERTEMADAPRWFARTHLQGDPRAVAYFSMEYGISEALPMYAGGLGVLAGDYLKTASDLGVPIVGIGLLYQRGYFRQVLDASGTQMEFYPSIEPGDVPILPLRGREGARLRVEVPMPGRSVYARAWGARVGRVPLYLLDTNDPENSAPDRAIASELYGGGQEMRLQQELVLGIGGWRLLEAVGADVEVCHLNEGHAAFAILERARTRMEREQVAFDVALAATRPGNVFTTHTPVAAGFDRFEPRLVAQYLGAYANDLGLSIEALLELGQGPGSDAFLPAYLAMRGSGAVNAVSRRHGEVSRQIFAGLFPRWPLAEVPVGFVTNGVHTPSWDSPDADRVWTEACGKDRWRDDLATVEKDIAAADGDDLWGMRARNRARLVTFVRERLAQQLRQAGAPSDAVEAAQRVFDPNALTIGMARRFATYKRPMLLLHDAPRLIRMLANTERPVQLVVAGKAHPADTAGKAMVREWAEFAARDDVRGQAVFLSDYDLLLAEELVRGVDLWINTPLPPWEACGTSGMKVLVNGGLNLSEVDGWWAEAYAPAVGWAIGESASAQSDDAAARELYERLEREIVPAFYTRDRDGVPGSWVERMRASMATLTPRFSTNRMLREYVDNYYISSAGAYRRRLAEHCEVARQIVGWQRLMREQWPAVRFGTPQVEANGTSYQYDVSCYLGGIDPKGVTVDLYAESPLERHAMQPLSVVADGSNLYRAVVSTHRPIGDFTPRAMPCNPDAIFPLEAPHIAWLR